jgi:hypothetical protein
MLNVWAEAAALVGLYGVADSFVFVWDLQGGGVVELSSHVYDSVTLVSVVSE